jgi:hypothetical protein
MLTLEKQNVKIANLNLREEKHGTDDVLACDLKLTAKLPNDCLAELHPTLKWSLYDKPETTDLAQDKTYMPILRYPKLGALDWSDVIVGGTFIIHAPVSGQDLEFMADANKLTFEPQEGGTIYVGMRVQFLPKPEQVGLLSALLGKEVEVSLQRPVATDLEKKAA